jgi:hypothetical protein
VTVAFHAVSQDVGSRFALRWVARRPGCTDQASLDYDRTAEVQPTRTGVCGGPGAFSLCNPYHHTAITAAAAAVDEGSLGRGYEPLLDCKRAIAVAAGYRIELIFDRIALVPARHHNHVVQHLCRCLELISTL